VYEVADDTYCCPGTTVLKNKIATRRQDVLDQFEAEMTSQRASEPMPRGNLDYPHYRAIHRHLFQDVYAWAGKPRSVRISKGDNPFCFPENIAAQANKLFADLKKKNQLRGLDNKAFAKEAAHVLAELNAVHPFREGNGRSQLSFLMLLAERASHPLDSDKIDPRVVMDAMIESFGGSEKPLADMIEGLIK
jgi:cell filamentation protein, protein adenylyltransferase